MLNRRSIPICVGMCVCVNVCVRFYVPVRHCDTINVL